MRILLALWVVGFIALIVLSFVDVAERRSIKEEYIIELVDQNTVKIYSPSTGRVYTCNPEEIYKYLEIDNL